MARLLSASLCQRMPAAILAGRPLAKEWGNAPSLHSRPMSSATPSLVSTAPIIRIADALAGRVAVNTAVAVRGWVRTRRDTKVGSGLSFIHLSDGSSFHPIQVVASAETLPNYQEEILKLNTGCSVIVEGALVASQGKGQSVEIQAKSVRVLGWVDDPDTYPVA